MTKREFLNAVIALNAAEVSEFAAHELEKMDIANEKRKNAPKKPSKTYIENTALVERIVTEILGEEPMSAAQVGQAMDCTAQKASSLLRRAVAEKGVIETEIIVAREKDGKTVKSKVKGYSL